MVGWCWAEPGKWPSVQSGAHCLGPDGHSREHMILNFLSWAEDVICAYGPRIVICEAPLNRKAAKLNEGYARFAIALVEIASALAVKHGAEALEADHNSVKLAWTGSGRADKPMMVAACRARGIRVASPDEADAVGLAYFALRERFGLEASTPLTRARR